MKQILGFNGENGFLSNFFLAPVRWKDVDWPCSENAYQWAKTGCDPAYIDTFKAYTPGQAKREGSKFNLDKEAWNKIKFGIMYEIVKEKFLQNDDLSELLLKTKNRDIIELNTWGDIYWGMVKKDDILVGKNHLGEILMVIRSHLRGWGLVF